MGVEHLSSRLIWKPQLSTERPNQSAHVKDVHQIFAFATCRTYVDGALFAKCLDRGHDRYVLPHTWGVERGLHEIAQVLQWQRVIKAGPCLPSFPASAPIPKWTVAARSTGYEIMIPGAYSQP